MLTSVAVDKYLRSYSEIETTILASAPSYLSYRHCVVIPAYNESINFFLQLQQSSLIKQRVLWIIVINQPERDSDTTINRALWNGLNGCGPLLWQHRQLSWRQISNTHSGMILVDRFTAHRRIPDKQGVGLARKLGVDIAITLLFRKQLQSPWIHSTDADTQLPTDYFTVVKTETLVEQYSALVYPFHHRPIADVAKKLITATRLYEQSMSYYVQRLAWAGSPYAYHSLGSCLAINAYSYCQVRGFPKRSGAEDFYLLNKLNKVKPVHSLLTPRLTISVRESVRVPFGTGPAVAKIQALANPESDYYSYNPEIFQTLKTVFEKVPTLNQHRHQLDSWFTCLGECLATELKLLGIQSLFDHLQHQCRSQVQCSSCFHQWFDAFKTLKLIHRLRRYYPDVPLHIALNTINQ